MNPYNVFNENERREIGRVEILENREYSVQETIELENKLAQDFVGNSKKQSIMKSRERFDIIDKLENCRKAEEING